MAEPLDAPTTTDTISGSSRSTVKGPPPIPKRQLAGNHSDSTIGAKVKDGKPLPMAQSLDAPAEEFVLSMEDLHPTRPKAATATVSDEQFAKYRAHKKKPVPTWMWMCIGGGMLVGVIVIIVAILVWGV